MITTVFESVNMRSTYYAERIFDAVSDTDIENGTFGYLSELADGESHIYNFIPGTKSDETIVVVDQPAWSEENSRITNQRKDKFIVEAGTPFRVRVLKKNDEFGISAEGITTDTRETLSSDEDVYFTIDTTGKLKASNTSSPDSQMEAKLMRKRPIYSLFSNSINNYGNSRFIYEAKITKLD